MLYQLQSMGHCRYNHHSSASCLLHRQHMQKAITQPEQHYILARKRCDKLHRWRHSLLMRPSNLERDGEALEAPH